FPVRVQLHVPARLFLDPNLEHALPRRDSIAGVEPDPIHSLVVDEGAVRASQVADLATGGVDLDQKVIARECRILRHRAMNEPRTPDDERVGALEGKRSALAWALENIQDDSH